MKISGNIFPKAVDCKNAFKKTFCHILMLRILLKMGIRYVAVSLLGKIENQSLRSSEYHRPGGLSAAQEVKFARSQALVSIDLNCYAAQCGEVQKNGIN